MPEHTPNEHHVFNIFSPGAKSSEDIFYAYIDEPQYRFGIAKDDMDEIDYLKDKLGIRFELVSSYWKLHRTRVYSIWVKLNGKYWFTVNNTSSFRRSSPSEIAHEIVHYMRTHSLDRVPSHKCLSELKMKVDLRGRV